MIGVINCWLPSLPALIKMTAPFLGRPWIGFYVGLAPMVTTPHAWQAAISVLSQMIPDLLPTWPAPATQAKTFALVEEASVLISAGMWRQHRRYVVAERWTGDRIGQLTAHLLTALDETAVYQVLAQHLPEMGIDAAWVAEFATDAGDPVALSNLRTVAPPGEQVRQFPTRAFPPPGWLSACG